MIKKELLLGASRDTIIKIFDEAIIGMDKAGRGKMEGTGVLMIHWELPQIPMLRLQT